MANRPGKKVFKQRYLHTDALDHLDVDDANFVHRAAQLAGLTLGRHFNIVRLDDDSAKVALLHYRDFHDDAFPALAERWLVDLASTQISYRTYEDSLNPPILHRKELLLPSDHPRWDEYAALTETAEQLGLFDQPTRIGYRAQWSHFIREQGYHLVGHRLLPVGNDESAPEDENGSLSQGAIARHRTALVRYGFSAPIQSLARNGYLDGSHTLFDYGCGRGDDVRGLVENNIDAAGWDPHFEPSNPIKEADIVNLGFVINVIEDFDERIEALSRAYSLAIQFLVVSVMLANENSNIGTPMHDGVRTKRNTFQKYFTQAELKAFVQAVLDEDPTPVGPGVFYVFRNKDAEQRFLSNRYRRRRNLLSERSATRSERHATRRAQLLEETYEKYRVPIEALWSTWLALGRKPEPAEIPMAAELIEGFGSLPKALRFISGRNGQDAIEKARENRVADLSVYLALQQFERKKAYKHLEPGLRRDIKAFFGTIGAANEDARSLLFEIADTDGITAACHQASNHGLGEYIPDQSLQLHTSLIEQLPPILRVYVGCATALYGDYRDADLIKIHVASGKLTLMKFDDFEGQPLPRMIERVKLKLREQDIEYFNYDEDGYPPPYLYAKSRYINEEYPKYPEQAAFDQQLTALPFLDLSGYGPSAQELHRLLEQHRRTIVGYELRRAQTVPDLDDPCGEYLTYRNLIECGESQARTGIGNLPRNPDSYSALLDLASNILDPVIDYYGMIKLTYGFCSAELEKEVPGRVAPKLDQHACHEKRKNGRYICSRLGSACDFIVEDEDMEEVAEWIASNTPFDRLYYYGSDLPIHVSFGSEHSRSFVDMTESPTGKLIPKVRQLSDEK